MWVVYPMHKRVKKRGSKANSRRKDLKLWAVMIIEDVRQTDDFTYEAELKRIFKEGERLITVWVRNDPRDQSDDAVVFGFVSPDSKRLAPLEAYLANLATKRVYDAIAATWSRQASLTDQ